ncbi:MAG: hypothetical protein ACRD4S_05150 [Candidatus Acidiferrales bacterium]
MNFPISPPQQPENSANHPTLATASLEDVAEYFGLMSATVSIVINRSPRVKFILQ